MNEREWTVDRSKGIGASEVAALAGASPWTTPVGVWMRKVGLIQDHQSNPMRMGHTLERALLRALADELNLRLVHNQVTFRHPDPAVPMYGTPDGFGPGRLSVAEVKVVGHRYDDWKGGPPEYVHLQVQAQMACYPKAQRAYVGALIGSELKTYRVDRDPQVINVLEEEVAAWWARYVVPEVSPDPEGPSDTWALLRARVSPDARMERVAGDHEAVLAAELVTLLAHQDHLAEQVEERRRRLAGAALDADLVGQGWRAGWTARRSTDWRGIVEAEKIPPAVVARYQKTAPTFTFRHSGQADPGSNQETP